MTITFPLILDILIVILLSATIGFAIVLNRRLSRLRENKAELDDLVKGFADAAGRAEVSVAGMKETASKAADALQKSIDRAQALRDELQFMIEAADSLASRLEGSVGAHTVRATTGPSPAAIKANARQQAPSADPGLRAPMPGMPQRPGRPAAATARSVARFFNHVRSPCGKSGTRRETASPAAAGGPFQGRARAAAGA